MRFTRLHLDLSTSDGDEDFAEWYGSSTPKARGLAAPPAATMPAVAEDGLSSDNVDSGEQSVAESGDEDGDADDDVDDIVW